MYYVLISYVTKGRAFGNMTVQTGTCKSLLTWNEGETAAKTAIAARLGCPILPSAVTVLRRRDAQRRLLARKAVKKEHKEKVMEKRRVAQLQRLEGELFYKSGAFHRASGGDDENGEMTGMDLALAANVTDEEAITDDEMIISSHLSDEDD